MATRPLYEITNDLVALNDLCNECEGDISDPQAEAAFDTFMNELHAEEGHKLDGYIGLMRTWEMEAAAAKAEAEQFATKARVRLARVERFKARLVTYLTVTGRTKVETARGRTILLATAGGKLPLKLEFDDVTTLPAEFTKTEVIPDKDAIFRHLDAGGSLPFASLGERGKYLKIK